LCRSIPGGETSHPYKLSLKVCKKIEKRKEKKEKQMADEKSNIKISEEILKTTGNLLALTYLKDLEKLRDEIKDLRSELETKKIQLLCRTQVLDKSLDDACLALLDNPAELKEDMWLFVRSRILSMAREHPEEESAIKLYDKLLSAQFSVQLWFEASIVRIFQDLRSSAPVIPYSTKNFITQIEHPLSLFLQKMYDACERRDLDAFTTLMSKLDEMYFTTDITSLLLHLKNQVFRR